MKYRKTILLIVAMALSASAYASDAAFPASYESAGNGISQDAEFPFTAAVKQNGKWGAVNGEGKQSFPLLMTRSPFLFPMRKSGQRIWQAKMTAPI